jgi:transcriptional regulator with XRE-family HTH domain
MQEGGAKMHRGARPNQVAMDRGERFKREIHARAAERGMFFDKDIAKKAGVSPNTLANWWQGKGLELGTLVSVAGVIDRSVFYLLDIWQGGEGSDYATGRTGRAGDPTGRSRRATGGGRRPRRRSVASFAACRTAKMNAASMAAKIARSVTSGTSGLSFRHDLVSGLATLSPCSGAPERRMLGRRRDGFGVTGRWLHDT